MEYLKLKKTDLTVSRLCMGGCPLGGYGWGETSEKDLIAAVRAALDRGFTFFDTADVYGLGQSEVTLGNALGSDRDKVVIASKFGVRIENGVTFYDNSPEWICKALEASLKRLGTDYIDLYQIHYRDTWTPIEQVVETLQMLRTKGYIRYFGLSNIHESGSEEFLPFADEFVSLQDEYSLACRKNENDLTLLSKALNVNPLTWGSLGQGILTGKYTRDNVNFKQNDRRSRPVYVNFYGEKLEQNLRIVEVMRGMAERHGKPVPAVAIRFILDHLPDSVVLCGAKRPEQMIANSEGADWHLDPEEMNLLDEISK